MPMTATPAIATAQAATAVTPSGEADKDGRSQKALLALTWLVWVGVHPMTLPQLQNRLRVQTQWFWSYFTGQRSSRLISERPTAATGEPPPPRGLTRMTPAFFPALAALAGSAMGGLTSLAAAWLTQNRQDRANRLSHAKARRQEAVQAVHRRGVEAVWRRARP